MSAMLLTNGVPAGSKDSVALDLVKCLVGGEDYEYISILYFFIYKDFSEVEITC